MPKKREYKLKEKVFIWPSDNAAWHFVYVPKKESAKIKEDFGAKAKGFRSLPVTAIVGKTSWDTSIFPDSHSGCYLIPLKAAVRKAEDIWEGDKLGYSIKIRM